MVRRKVVFRLAFCRFHCCRKGGLKREDSSVFYRYELWVTFACFFGRCVSTRFVVYLFLYMKRCCMPYRSTALRKDLSAFVKVSCGWKAVPLRSTFAKSC